MAAKKTEAKPKAQPKAKAEPKAVEPSVKQVSESEPLTKPDLFEPVGQFSYSMQKPSLPMTADQLANMGRQFKAGQLSRQIVIDAHSAYLNAVKQGAEASEADVKFVKGHLEVLKNWPH